MHEAEEEGKLPLVLLVAARGAESEGRAPLEEREAGRQRGARALAGLQGSGQALGQPEHLAARIELEAERRDGRRGLQPASGRRRRDHVAPAIDDVERSEEHTSELQSLMSITYAVF